MKKITRRFIFITIALISAWPFTAYANTIDLQNATATYSQDPVLWSASKTIDGNISGSFVSWAVFDPDNGVSAQTIVWETTNDLFMNPDMTIQFTLHHQDYIPRPGHNLGCFRLSYTTDDRSDFADGLNYNGDVSANWTVIDPISTGSSGGETFTILSDSSLLVSGGANWNSTYQVNASLSAAGITGFRLEALENPSLPFQGPGREPANGNFHLSEFRVSAAPIPGAIWLFLSGLIALWGVKKYK